MRNKTFYLIMLTILVTTVAFAQKEYKLIGEWDVKFVEDADSAILEFKEEGGVIIGYFISYTDHSGKKHKTNDKVHTSIQFDGKNGQSNYKLEWDDQSFSFEAKFKMIDKNTIKSTYLYNKIPLKETWVRKSKKK